MHLAYQNLFFSLAGFLELIGLLGKNEREKKQGDGIQQYMMRVSNPIIMVVVVAVIDGRISRRGGRTFLR